MFLSSGCPHVFCLPAVRAGGWLLSGAVRSFRQTAYDTANILLIFDIRKKFKKNLRKVCTLKFLHYLCNPVRQVNGNKVREISSVGSERLPYKQRVGGSNPSSPTRQTRNFWSVFFVLPQSPPIRHQHIASGREHQEVHFKYDSHFSMYLRTVKSASGSLFALLDVTLSLRLHKEPERIAFGHSFFIGRLFPWTPGIQYNV